MSAARISLGDSVQEILELGTDGFPLTANVAHRTQLPENRLAELQNDCQRILETCGQELTKAAWYNSAWLALTLKDAPARFVAAFDRWRELYRGAIRQRNEARVVLDNHRASKQDRENAEQQEREAKREMDLLLNRTETPTESDFYPYRYLASEGFLPGYNFPRLPLRAMLPAGDKVHIVDRPRFLGIAEFGPRNVLYHEGRKYRMVRCILPSGGVEGRLKKAKFCKLCGYFHSDDNVGTSVCQHCRTPMDGQSSEFQPRLFEMTSVWGRRADRITCDEEERVRRGFEMEVYYRFAAGSDGNLTIEKAVCCTETGAPADSVKASYTTCEGRAYTSPPL